MSYIVGIRAHCAMIGFIISFRIHTAQLVTQFACNAAMQCLVRLYNARIFIHLVSTIVVLGAPDVYFKSNYHVSLNDKHIHRKIMGINIFCL